MNGLDEDARNMANAELFQAIIREAFDGVQWVGTGHHFMFQREGNTLPEAIPSADALIFDHAIAKRIFGDHWQTALTQLALEPVETRDALLGKLYHAQKPDGPSPL